ncbi:MAG: hypothetical protein CMJ64_03155 [Planctomycetaceae bacterium]|jgi:N-acetylglutamate synthase-like GNAT family acetyltransferase|nr:hypothetical protein [Planctomycetaceae bacterium]
MAECIIRIAVESDVPALESVARSAIATLRKIYRPTAKAIARKRTIVPELQQLVAVLDGQVVGSVEYRIKGDRVHFLSLFVHEDYRRQGIGKELLAELEGVGRWLGAQRLSACTVKETGNPEIFRHMGFIVLSEEPTDLYQSDKFDRLHESYMERPIE